MDKLRLGFADTFDGAKEYFTHLLSKRFEIIRDDVRPDYLIFGDRNFGESNKRYENCVRIFYTGENQRPSDYRCDFAISFDHPTSNSMFRLPLYLIYEYDHKIWQNRQARHENDFDKKEFCSFVVKNPGCQYRNAYFLNLNQIALVKAAGPLYNNMPGGWRPETGLAGCFLRGAWKGIFCCFPNPLVSLVGLVGFHLPLFRKDGRSLHDLATFTQVVDGQDER